MATNLKCICGRRGFVVHRMDGCIERIGFANMLGEGKGVLLLRLFRLFQLPGITVYVWRFAVLSDLGDEFSRDLVEQADRAAAQHLE